MFLGKHMLLIVSYSALTMSHIKAFLQAFTEERTVLHSTMFRHTSTANITVFLCLLCHLTLLVIHIAIFWLYNYYWIDNPPIISSVSGQLVINVAPRILTPVSMILSKCIPFSTVDSIMVMVAGVRGPSLCHPMDCRATVCAYPPSS